MHLNKVVLSAIVGTVNGGKTRYLTKEQEADEIIKRLSTPPRTTDDIDDMLTGLALQIQKEIDNSILCAINGTVKKDAWTKRK